VFTRIPLGRVLDRDDARELDHARLGRCVADLRVAGEADAGGRGDVDDRSASLLFHHRNDVLAPEKHALEIEVDLRVPGLLGHLDRAARRRAPDVVDEHVDPTIGLHAGVHHRGDVLGARDVAEMGGDGSARFVHAFHGLAQPLGIAIHGEDLRAFLGEAHRGRASVAPARSDRARTGDDRDLAIQTARHRPNR